MFDFISRDSVLEQIMKLPRVDRCAVYDADSVEDIIRFEPAADVVEVVRCGQCKHWTGIVLGSRCNYHSFPPNSFIYKQKHDFCSKGERRSSDETD